MAKIFVKRIAHLAKQNKELEEYIKKLERQNEELSTENEKLKAASNSKAMYEKSLKFNMATVLFADIHGFSKLVETMDSSVIMDELDEILY